MKINTPPKITGPIAAVQGYAFTKLIRVTFENLGNIEAVIFTDTGSGWTAGPQYKARLGSAKPLSFFFGVPDDGKSLALLIHTFDIWYKEYPLLAMGGVGRVPPYVFGNADFTGNYNGGAFAAPITLVSARRNAAKQQVKLKLRSAVMTKKGPKPVPGATTEITVNRDLPVVHSVFWIEASSAGSVYFPKWPTTGQPLELPPPPPKK